MCFIETPAPSIAPIMAAWPPASLLRLSDAAPLPRRAVPEAIAKIEQRSEAEFVGIKLAADALFSELGTLRNSIGTPEIDAVDFEALVLQLEESERRVQRDRRVARLAKEARRIVAPHGRPMLERFDRAIARTMSYRRFVLATLRDARWELMAIDAMRNTLSGRAFDDPKHLKRHLLSRVH